MQTLGHHLLEEWELAAQAGQEREKKKKERKKETRSTHRTRSTQGGVAPLRLTLSLSEEILRIRNSRFSGNLEKWRRGSLAKAPANTMHKLVVQTAEKQQFHHPYSS